MVARIAYEEGARDVVINWKDELFSKIRYLHAPDVVFGEFPQWQKEFYMSYANTGAAFLSIYAVDPELFKDVNPERIVTEQKTRNTALAEYRERLMSNRNVWCVMSIPTEAWACKVFPELSGQEAVERLWDEIFKAVRVYTDDPVAAWQKHKNELKQRLDFLNAKRFRFLHYRNSLGTDFRVELPGDHVWMGGSDFTPEGLEFIANMPTEEVFTLPLRTGIEGTVVSSMPLNYNGVLIDRFSLKFKEGSIIDFHAEKGYEALKGLVETDEGSRYLGEVALVPYDSPISNSKILFYNTLFDENASCHLAIGKAYPLNLKNGENMSKEELLKQGVNDSLVHEDFMIGTKDLEITGTTIAGDEIPVFINGNFAF
jgi:aminopeptidase